MVSCRLSATETSLERELNGSWTHSRNFSRVTQPRDRQVTPDNVLPKYQNQRLDLLLKCPPVGLKVGGSTFTFLRKAATFPAFFILIALGTTITQATGNTRTRNTESQLIKHQQQWHPPRRRETREFADRGWRLALLQQQFIA